VAAIMPVEVTTWRSETAGDGRTRALEIEDSMLGPENLARTLLFQLHEDEPEDE
jgi:hypothetical protein